MKRILLSILLTGILLLSACGAPTTVPPAEAPPIEQTTPEAETPATEPEVTTPTPAPVPTPTLSGMGERVDIGKGAFIIVESFKKREGLGFITVLVDNSGGFDDIAVSSLMSFDVKDSDGNKAEIDIFADRDHPAPEGTILIGDKLRGTLVYDITRLSEGLTLYFLPDLLSRPVRIKLKATEITTPTPAPAPEPVQESEPAPIGSSRENPLPMGESLVTPEGIEITLINLIEGNQAWEIIHEANMFNDPPAAGMQYVIITFKVKNISSEEESWRFSATDFELIGSSNKVFHSFDQSVVLPDEGSLSKLRAELYHGGEEIGSLSFHIPEGETNLVMIWESFLKPKRFFEVK